MTTISGTLKPCPWCGGEAETRNSRWNRRDHWGVACTGCGDPWFDCRSDIEAEAIAAWNNREAAEARVKSASEDDLTHAYLSGHAKGVVETEAAARAASAADMRAGFVAWLRFCDKLSYASNPKSPADNVESGWFDAWWDRNRRSNDDAD